MHAPDPAVELGGCVYVLLSEVASAIREVQAATRRDLYTCPGCAGPVGEFRRRVAAAVAAHQARRRDRG